MWQFHLDRPGRYLVTVRAEDHTTAPAAIAIGPGIGQGLVSMVLAILAALGLIFVAVLIAGVTALVRHSRAKAA